MTSRVNSYPVIVTPDGVAILPVVGETMAAFDLDSYAWYEDGTEAGSTIIGVKNVSQSIDVDTTRHIRMLLQETAGGAAANQEFKLQYRHVEGTNTWTDVNATSSVARSQAGGLVEDADTTQRLGSGTFISTNGCQDEVGGDTLLNGVDFAGSDEVECVWSIQIRSADVANDDTVDFRLSTVSGSVPPITNQPTCTVVEAPPPTLPDEFLLQIPFQENTLLRM